MAKVPIRKPKRATLLTKRSVCLAKKFREKSHKILYENVKKNNSYLAKALSHEKQNNQNLFKQNLSLFAEIQNLNLTCNKQTSIITNIQNNAKEILKMLVTMTNFLTNTLTMCQEFVTSNNNARLSSVSTGRKESSKKMSPKSPAKGVVKPMVSGHTITKPTINLSRINTENITNISRLSIVQEVLTPERNEENENRSSITTPFATSPLRYENRRMPERMRISSPRVSDAEVVDNEQRKQRRSRHSRRMGSYTRLESERWSVDETPRHSRDRISIGSPRVKLRDVSKLLQDSRTINIRRLIGSRIDDVEIQESSNDVSQDTLERNVITETQMSINVNEGDESYIKTPKMNSDAKTRKVSEKAFNETLYTAGSSRQNNRNWEDDPLEGPSWLFSNTLNMPSPDNEREELDRSHNFDVNNNSEIAYAESSDTESIEEDQSRNSVESVNVSNTSSTRSVSGSVINHAGCESSLIDDNNTDNNICETISNISDRERVNDAEDKSSFASFITLRRGHSEVTEEEEDDFTLMLTCPSPQNLQFNINDLRLPDDDIVTNSARENGIDNASLTNTSFVLNQTEHAQIKQPLILINNDEIPSNKKKQQKNNKNKKAKTSKLKDETDQSENGSRLTKKAKQKINLESNRDPSAAKVVLEKLNESHIKSRVLSDDDMEFRRINDYTTDIDNQGDSQSLDSENQRPKRRNTPITLKEPSLRKKLRRE